MKSLFPCFLRFSFLLLWLAIARSTALAQAMPVTFVTYNTENLFDCQHDSLKNDYEFLPDGERKWTGYRYWQKVNAIGKTIIQCGGEGKAWRLPDLVALMEVENDSVMMMLCRASMLRNGNYNYVMTASADERGMDVALLYNTFTFRLASHNTLRVKPMDDLPPTRDILYVKGYLRSKDTLHIFALHAPSRSGGEKLRENYRIAVVQRVSEAVDSIRSVTNDANIIIAGDFNDYSYDKSLKLLARNKLVEISRKAVGKKRPKEVIGTYRFKGKWGSLDHIFLSPSLVPKAKECFILDNPWLLELNPKGFYMPRRTYQGTHYHGGVSDHLPLVVNLSF